MKEKKAIPAYQTIERYLQALIDSGAGRSEPLPAEPEVAAQFNVSRMTARHAFQRLVNAGIIVRKRGVGSFVNGRLLERLPIAGIPDFSGWTDSSDVNYIVESYGVVKAPTHIVKDMGLKKGAKVTHLERTRSLNGVYSLDTRYMPASVYERISSKEIERKSLLVLLKQIGIDITSGQVELNAHSATPEESERLGVAPGHPILERRLVYRDTLGTGVLLGSSRYPGGQAYTFRLQFESNAASNNVAMSEE
ncbi:MAG: GntR family transcriptional regulator [Pusillimonas sp.]